MDYAFLSWLAPANVARIKITVTPITATNIAKIRKKFIPGLGQGEQSKV